MKRIVMLSLVSLSCVMAHSGRVRDTTYAAGWQCPTQPKIKCGDKPECGRWDRSWIATCPADGRMYDCGYGSNSITECTESKESRAKVRMSILIDRLAIQTGCSPQEISLVAESAWSTAGETAYRMLACGSYYMCTIGRGVSCLITPLSTAPSDPTKL